MTDFESGVCVGMLLKSGGSSAKLQTLNVGSNGIYYPDTGYDGFSNVTVAVRPRLTTLSVTENGTYTPPSAYDGFDVVRVNCSDRYNEGYRDAYNECLELMTDSTSDETYDDGDGTYTFPGGGVDTENPLDLLNLTWATGSGYVTDTSTGWCLCYTFTQKTDDANAKLKVWCENIKTGTYAGILDGLWDFIVKNIRFAITGTNPTEEFNTIRDAFRPDTGKYYTTYTDKTRVSSNAGLRAMFRGTGHKYVTSRQKPSYAISNGG